MTSPTQQSPHHYRNWLSLAGLIISGGGLFAFLLLFAIDTFGSHSNPYMGILAYIVAPGFMFLGMFIGGMGIYVQCRNARGARFVVGHENHEPQRRASLGHVGRMLEGHAAVLRVLLHRL